MLNTTRRSIFLLTILFISSTANANSNQLTCAELLRSVSADNSLKAVIARATENLDRAMKLEPLPISSNINTRRLQKWTGENGPKSFEPFLAGGVKFLKTPDVNSEHAVMSMRKHPGNSALLHVDMPFKGQDTSTKVYVSRPLIDSTVAMPNGEYLIGPEFKSVVWHIHGGGTPSAVAANASSKAQVFLKKGIPLIAVDQPGHGNGPTIAFLNDEEIFDWNYELMRRLIHPSVDIHLQGHSWGGMFTTKMWQLSHTDKYKQIVSYQAESPGADLSLGKGTAREKARLDREINDSITDWEDRAAPSDVDFLKNTIENRKMSPVAQEYTFLTDIFYRWEHLTDAEIAQRKRLNVLVGTYDGLVYVGREDIYDGYYSRVAGENYHKFTRGTTFRGSDIEQGHQIFDLVDEAGEFAAYKIGTDLIHEVSGTELAKQADQSQFDTLSVLNKLFNHYANNFAFREFLEKQTEYIEVFNGRHGELLEELQKLKFYLGSVEKINKEFQSGYAASINNQVATWSAQFDVRGGIKKAIAEIGIDDSLERKQLLIDYIENVKSAETQAKKEFHDSEYEVELKQFDSKYGDIEQGNISERVRTFETVQDAQKILIGLHRKIEKTKNDPIKTESLGKEVSNLFKNLNIELPEYNLAAIESYSKALKTPPDSIESNHDKKLWQKSFERALQEYKVVIKGHKRRFGEAMILASESVTPPKGVFGRSDAEWELSVNLTEARKDQLQAYIDQYDEFVEKVKENLEMELQAKLSKIEPINGLTSVEEVAKRLDEVSSILNKRFVPSVDHPSYNIISNLVNSLKSLDKELSLKEAGSFSFEIQQIDKKILKLKGIRSSKVVSLNKLLEASTPSDTLNKSMEVYKHDLNTLIEVNQRYAHQQEDFYLELFERNAFSRENVLDIPDHLKAMANEYEQALSIADVSAAELKTTKLIEAAKGHLTSELDKDGTKLKSVIDSLLGDFKFVDGHVEPGISSIEREILDLENKYAELETKLFKTRVKIVELEREYLKILSDENIEKSFVEVMPVNMSELLSKDLNQLLTELDSADGKVKLMALKKTLNQWEELWSRVNIDDNFKQSDVYNLAL